MPRPLPGCRLIRLLHEGAAAEVWLGRLDFDGSTVVVKRSGDPTDEATWRHLVDAGTAAANADHPDLLAPLGLLEDPPGFAVVYPFVEGGTLRGILEERGALGPGELVALLAPVAAMLDDLAPTGFVHGDLTPANILIRTDGTPVVADPAPPGAAAPAYLDPSVAAGREPCTRSDVYSLGVIAYEALIGRRPHRGSPAQVVAMAAAGAHRRLDTWPGVSEQLAVAVETALEPDPEDRYDDPTRFVEALRAAVDPAEVTLPGPVLDAGVTLVDPEERTLEFGPRPARTNPDTGPNAESAALARHRPWRRLAAAVTARSRRASLA